MHRQAVLVSAGRPDRVLFTSSESGLVELIGPARVLRSIRAEGETAPRSGLLAAIDASVTQESFRIETHVGLHYYGGYS